MSERALRSDGVGVRFSGLVALDGVDVVVRPGEVLGLIGPNGSGKSTLVNVLSGIQRPTAGRCSIDGVDVTGASSTTVARQGVARTFQTVRLFAGLSVRDNVAGVSRSPLVHMDQWAFHWLDRFGVGHLADRRAGDLAYGLQRRVEIARALATRPRYLLLDEPAAGLNEDESEALESSIRAVVDDSTLGCGALVIDHDMRLIAAVCDRVQVLFNGKTIAEGTPAQVRRDRQVVEAYLGTAGREEGGGRH